jgi:hypothetical protein
MISKTSYDRRRMIRALRIGMIGRRYMGARAGQLFALQPDPVDSDDAEWERDFDRLVGELIRALERRFGQPSVVAPPRASQQSWWARLKRSGNRPQDITNPDKLSPDAALGWGLRDDSYLEFASVEFGRDAKLPSPALMFTSDGHPIIWIWLDDDVAPSWSEIVEETRGGLPCSALDIAWERLLPEKPRLSIELPRATLHRGESASWTDGARSLGFHAGLGVRPPEVYLPPESAWASASPGWAAMLRGSIVRDFEQLGVRVVEMANADVRDGHPEERST